MICRVLALAALALSSSASNSQTIETLMGGVPENHCSEAQSTVDGKTIACLVWNNDPGKFSAPLQLELYRNRHRIVTLEPGTPIREWHFWQRGDQVSIHTGRRGEPGAYQLYDTATGKLLAQLDSPASLDKLPQWAKDRAQLADESVPEGPAYSQQRTLWIAKVLRQIDLIHPGMTRKDFQSTFTTEGGLSAREWQTFVYKDCPLIKVNVVFSQGATEAEDKIVSISPPYLAFPGTD